MLKLCALLHIAAAFAPSRAPHRAATSIRRAAESEWEAEVNALFELHKGVE